MTTNVGRSSRPPLRICERCRPKEVDYARTEQDGADDGRADRGHEDCRGGQILCITSTRMKPWFKQIDDALDRRVQGLSTQDQSNCAHENKPFDCGDSKIETQQNRNKRGNNVNPEIPLGQPEPENSATGVRKALRAAFQPFRKTDLGHSLFALFGCR